MYIESSNKNENCESSREKEEKSINLNEKLSAIQRVGVVSCLKIYETD